MYLEKNIDGGWEIILNAIAKKSNKVVGHYILYNTNVQFHKWHVKSIVS